MNIRMFVVRAAMLHDLVELGTITHQAAQFLDASVRAGLNIIVAGGTQAGNPTIPKDSLLFQGAAVRPAPARAGELLTAGAVIVGSASEGRGARRPAPACAI